MADVQHIVVVVVYAADGIDWVKDVGGGSGHNLLEGEVSARSCWDGCCSRDLFAGSGVVVYRTVALRTQLERVFDLLVVLDWKVLVAAVGMVWLEVFVAVVVSVVGCEAGSRLALPVPALHV